MRTVLKFKSSTKKRKDSNVVSEIRTSSVRLARLMALAILFEDMLATEEVADHAELTRRFGVASSQISRIMVLNILTPDLQQQLLSLAGSEANLALKHVAAVCRESDWSMQIAKFDLCKQGVSESF